MSSRLYSNSDLSLINKELAYHEISKFRGQKKEFTSWLSMVGQVFTYYYLEEAEKFEVVVSKLRGQALQWWENYKYKRKKKGKEKIRTWRKLKCKIMEAFCPSTYTHTHPSTSLKRSGAKSPPSDILFFKRSPKSSCTFNHAYTSQNSPPSSPKLLPTATQNSPKSYASNPPPQTLPKANVTKRRYRCHGLGHLASDSPYKRVVPLVEFHAQVKESREEVEGPNLLPVKEVIPNKDEEVIEEEESNHCDPPPIVVAYDDEDLLDFEEDEVVNMAKVDTLSSKEEEHASKEIRTSPYKKLWFKQEEKEEYTLLNPSLYPQVEQSYSPMVRVTNECFESSPLDGYVGVFSRLMGVRFDGVGYSLQTAPTSFKNSYMFKKHGTLSTLPFSPSSLRQISSKPGCMMEINSKAIVKGSPRVQLAIKKSRTSSKYQRKSKELSPKFCPAQTRTILGFFGSFCLAKVMGVETLKTLS